MKVLKKEPGREWTLEEVNNDLNALQREVGGYIETVTIADDVVILCNEEGRLKDCPENCEIDGITFVGTILICGYEGEDFANCPEDVIEEFVDVNGDYFDIR